MARKLVAIDGGLAKGGPHMRPPEPRTSRFQGGTRAAMIFETVYEEPRNAEDKEAFDQAKKGISSSTLSKAKIAAAMEFAAVCENEAGGRFSIMHGGDVMKLFALGKISDEHLSFEKRLMEAWCGGELREFIESERIFLTNGKLPDVEKSELVKLLDLSIKALGMRPILSVVGASALRAYYSDMPGEDRLELIMQASYVLGSVPLSREDLEKAGVFSQPGGARP
jgi:hypothetical protein